MRHGNTSPPQLVTAERILSRQVQDSKWPNASPSYYSRALGPRCADAIHAATGAPTPALALHWPQRVYCMQPTLVRGGSLCLVSTVLAAQPPQPCSPPNQGRETHWCIALIRPEWLLNQHGRCFDELELNGSQVGHAHRLEPILPGKDHIWPRAGEQYGHIGPRAGEHGFIQGPRIGGFSQSLVPSHKRCTRAGANSGPSGSSAR